MVYIVQRKKHKKLGMDKIYCSTTKNVSKENKISMGAEESAANQLKDIWKSIKR